MGPSPNTPFVDLVIVVVDTPQELARKRQQYIGQGYREAPSPFRHEDIIVDLQYANGPIIQVPMLGAVVAFFTRKD